MGSAPEVTVTIPAALLAAARAVDAATLRVTATRTGVVLEAASWDAYLRAEAPAEVERDGEAYLAIPALRRHIRRGAARVTIGRSGVLVGDARLDPADPDSWIGGAHEAALVAPMVVWPVSAALDGVGWARARAVDDWRLDCWRHLHLFSDGECVAAVAGDGQTVVRGRLGGAVPPAYRRVTLPAEMVGALRHLVLPHRCVVRETDAHVECEVGCPTLERVIVRARRYEGRQPDFEPVAAAARVGTAEVISVREIRRARSDVHVGDGRGGEIRVGDARIPREVMLRFLARAGAESVAVHVGAPGQPVVVDAGPRWTMLLYGLRGRP